MKTVAFYKWFNRPFDSAETASASLPTSPWTAGLRGAGRTAQLEELSSSIIGLNLRVCVENSAIFPVLNLRKLLCEKE